MSNPNKYVITYSNHFEFNGKKLAFRKGYLFDIGFLPNYLPMKDNNGSLGWWVNRKWLSKSTAKELAKDFKPIDIDVSDLNCFTQIELDECFNLVK
jgi:hypothetical protein